MLSNTESSHVRTGFISISPLRGSVLWLVVQTFFDLYKNAMSANNMRLELDIRTDLSFISLRNWNSGGRNKSVVAGHGSAGQVAPFHVVRYCLWAFLSAYCVRSTLVSRSKYARTTVDMRWR